MAVLVLADGSWECIWPLGAHDSKGQTVDGACGAASSSQLHHKLSLFLCLLASSSEARQRSSARPPELTYPGP